MSLTTDKTEGAIAFLKAIWGPMERGETDSYSSFFDALADDFVLTNTLGEVRGKDALIAYFDKAVDSVDYKPFVRPLEYFANENRIVQIGQEELTVKATGKTLRRDYAWVVDVKDGKIASILNIQDLSGVEAEVSEALDYARTATQ